MTVKNVLTILEEWAPSSYAEDFDNVGLLVGNPDQSCSGILVCLDCLEAVVDEAILQKCNTIVSFHPILFEGLKKITGKDYVERVVIKAIQNNIAIIAMHTRLDNHPQGVSDVIATQLGLLNTQILMPKTSTIKKLLTYVPESHFETVLQAIHDAGGGSIGNYEECSFSHVGTGQFKGNAVSQPALGKPHEKTKVQEVQIQMVFKTHQEAALLRALHQSHPYESVAYEIITTDNIDPDVGMGMIGDCPEILDAKTFMESVKKKLNCSHIRHTTLLKDPIKKVAVLGGSGSFAIAAAKQQKADVFITSDLKYHQFFQAENQLILMDIGHYESEQFTKNLIFDYLTKKMPNFAIVLSNINSNPVNYF